MKTQAFRTFVEQLGDLTEVQRAALAEALAGILTLASDSKKASPASEKDLSQIKLVAGARSHLYRTDFRLNQNADRTP